MEEGFFCLRAGSRGPLVTTPPPGLSQPRDPARPQSCAERRSERERELASSQLLGHVGGEVICESEGATRLGAGGDGKVWNSCCGEGDWESTGAKYQTAELRLEGRRALPCLVNSLCSIQESLHLLSAVGRQKQEAGGGVTQG